MGHTGHTGYTGQTGYTGTHLVSREAAYVVHLGLTRTVQGPRRAASSLYLTAFPGISRIDQVRHEPESAILCKRVAANGQPHDRIDATNRQTTVLCRLLPAFPGHSPMLWRALCSSNGWGQTLSVLPQSRRCHSQQQHCITTVLQCRSTSVTVGLIETGAFFPSL